MLWNISYKVQILVSIPCTILSIQSTILYILFYLIMAITVTDQRNLIYEYVQKFVTNDYDAKNFLRRVWEYEEWNDDDLQEQVRLRIQQAKDTHIQCTLDIIFAYTMDNMSYLRSMLSSEQEQHDCCDERWDSKAMSFVSWNNSKEVQEKYK